MFRKVFEAEVEEVCNRRLAAAHLKCALRCPLEDVEFHVSQARHLDAIADMHAASAKIGRALWPFVRPSALPGAV